MFHGQSGGKYTDGCLLSRDCDHGREFPVPRLGTAGRIVLIGTLGYTGMLLLMRTAGKRTLSQMSAFDFVITLALGASFGRVMTSQDVPIIEVLAAFATLVGLQYLLSYLRVNYSGLRGLASRPPTCSSTAVISCVMRCEPSW
jgi:hypothetical protein